MSYHWDKQVYPNDLQRQSSDRTVKKIFTRKTILYRGVKGTIDHYAPPKKHKTKTLIYSGVKYENHN